MKFTLTSLLMLAFLSPSVQAQQINATDGDKWTKALGFKDGVMDIVDADYALGNHIGLKFYLTGVASTPFVKYTKNDSKETGYFGACFESLTGDNQGNLVGFRFRAAVPEVVKKEFKLAPEAKYIVVENGITPDSDWKKDCSKNQCMITDGWVADENGTHILQSTTPKIVPDELSSQSLAMKSNKLLLRWSQYESYMCEKSSK